MQVCSKAFEMVSRQLSSKARYVYNVKRFKCKQYNDPFLIAILGRKEEVQLSKPAISMPASEDMNTDFKWHKPKDQKGNI
mgnify:CR=1 FL=1